MTKNYINDHLEKSNCQIIQRINICKYKFNNGKHTSIFCFNMLFPPTP